jgi:hypothetical protein
VQRPEVTFGIPPAVRERLELCNFTAVDVFHPLVPVSREALRPTRGAPRNVGFVHRRQPSVVEHVASGYPRVPDAAARRRV